MSEKTLLAMSEFMTLGATAHSVGKIKRLLLGRGSMNQGEMKSQKVQGERTLGREDDKSDLLLI